MNRNNDQQEFIYTYSAKDKEEIDRIRQKYTIDAHEDKLRQLHDLDASVQNRASAASIAVGVVGSLIMGLGMSVVMTEIGQIMGLGLYATPVGIIIGIAGLAAAICAYPIYRTVSERRKKQIAPKILALLDELDREKKKSEMNQNHNDRLS